MPETPPTEEGISSSLTGLVRTLRDTVENRVELLLVELKEERIHQLEMTILMVLALFCGLMTLVMLTVILVVCFWDTNRMLVLSLVAAAYAAGATGALLKVRAMRKQWHPFAATLEEIKQDAACFKKTN